MLENDIGEAGFDRSSKPLLSKFSGSNPYTPLRLIQRTHGRHHATSRSARVAKYLTSGSWSDASDCSAGRTCFSVGASGFRVLCSVVQVSGGVLVGRQRLQCGPHLVVGVLGFRVWG